MRAKSPANGIVNWAATIDIDKICSAFDGYLCCTRAFVDTFSGKLYPKKFLGWVTSEKRKLPTFSLHKEA
jgi:hypothetical protein